MTLPEHHTKIVATLGPVSREPAVLARLLRAGLNVARINLAHGNVDQHAEVISNVRHAASRLGRRVAILADLPGPKLRLGKISPEPVELEQGQEFILTTESIVGDKTRASVNFSQLPKAVHPHEPIFLNDGFVELEVCSILGSQVHCKVKAGGELRSHKGINIPHLHVDLESFTSHDHELLQFACRQNVDAVGISFVQTAADVQRVRKEAVAMGASPCLIAKIECASALPRIDSILEQTDGIMVARGDLGVETPIEGVALVQKRLIRKANLAGKPVITATQMLESMTNYRRPTRAEASDVANAVLDGTDAVMLSEESAIGRYPVEAVEMLAKIAIEAEKNRPDYSRLPLQRSLLSETRVEEIIASNVVTAVERLGTACVVTPTESGASARRISRFHLPAWIVALSPHEPTCQKLLFSYGVYPVNTGSDPRDWPTITREILKREKLWDGPVVLTQGPSRENPGATNRMEILQLDP